MRIVHLTPGTGSFHCGSCLRDHALIKALRRRGHDAMMVPLYLPLVTDQEEVQSKQPVRVGGVSLYFQQRMPWFYRLPSWVHRLLNHPNLLRRASRGIGMTSPRVLGEMTLGSLLGREGRQWGEWQKLVAWVREECRPDVVSLSNSLLSGLASALREMTQVPVVCSLQGEDSFLDTLPDPWRAQAWEAMRQNARSVSCFLAPSQFYQKLMADRLGVEPERVAVLWNGIESDLFHPTQPNPESPVIGYLARMIHGKGLGTLVDAFIELAQRHPQVQLKIGGAMTDADIGYVKSLQDRLAMANCGNRVTWHPNLSFEDKVRFYEGLTVFSVPATYGEAFGLYLIEAMASGVPVVQPEHGAFPELIQATGGGLICAPDDSADLAVKLETLLMDDVQRQTLSAQGLAAVRKSFSPEAMAERFEEILVGLSAR